MRHSPPRRRGTCPLPSPDCIPARGSPTFSRWRGTTLTSLWGRIPTVGVSVHPPAHVCTSGHRTRGGIMAERRAGEDKFRVRGGGSMEIFLKHRTLLVCTNTSARSIVKIGGVCGVGECGGMVLKSTTSSGVGAAIFAFCASALSLLPVIAHFVPTLESAREYQEALHLYSKYLRLPVAGIVANITGSHISLYAIDLVFFWVAIFVAVNIFIWRSDDGLLVWGHIKRNGCFTAGRGFLATSICTLPKFLVAFALAPFVCVAAMISRIWTHRSMMTMANITVDPGEVGRYFGLFVAAPVFLILIWPPARWLGAI